MDMKQLNTFLTVSSLLNFTKAADRLGYAQSSITAQIRQLENELETLLFERIGKKVTLTDSGRRLVSYAEQILQLSDNMKNAVLRSRLYYGGTGASGIHSSLGLAGAYFDREKTACA